MVCTFGSSISEAFPTLFSSFMMNLSPKGLHPHRTTMSRSQPQKWQWYLACTLLLVWLLPIVPQHNGSEPTSTSPHHHHAVKNASSLPEIRQKLKQRFSILRHIALSRPEGTQHHHKRMAGKECSTTSFILITDSQFGNSGNNLISFTNMLWLASVLNATLAVPPYMDTILKPFDLTTLHKTHCFVVPDSKPGNRINDIVDKKAGNLLYEVESGDAFFLYKLFNHSHTLRPLLPAYNPALIAELSHHYLRVYSGFWCCPKPDVVAFAEYVIMNHLGGMRRLWVVINDSIHLYTNPLLTILTFNLLLLCHHQSSIIWFGRCGIDV